MTFLCQDIASDDRESTIRLSTPLSTKRSSIMRSSSSLSSYYFAGNNTPLKLPLAPKRRGDQHPFESSSKIQIADDSLRLISQQPYSDDGLVVSATNPEFWSPSKRRKLALPDLDGNDEDHNVENTKPRFRLEPKPSRLSSASEATKSADASRRHLIHCNSMDNHAVLHISCT